jgi:ATP-grasp domain
MGKPPKVLIFTTINWAATAQLGLALAGKGLEVATIAPRDHGIRDVRAIKTHYRSVSYSATASFVARVIERWMPSMVIPCDDLAICCLHQLHSKAIRGDGRDPETIKAVVETSLGDPASYYVARKRSSFMVFAKDEGLRVPETTTISDLKDLVDHLETSSFPQVLKLDGTSSGLGVRIVNNGGEARRAYHDLVTMCGWRRASKRALKQLSLEPFVRRWTDQIPGITLQHYIAGVPANRAVLCWQGKVLAGLSVEAVRTAHATGPATVVRILDNAEIAEATGHVVRRLGLSGFVGFDFILERTSGRAFLIEMNPRPTPICHLSPDSQRDMTWALFTKLCDGKGTKSAARFLGKVIALFPGEFWRDPNSEYLLSCHHDVPWEEPQLISAYARPLSPYSFTWINKLFSQLREAFVWTAN